MEAWKKLKKKKTVRKPTKGLQVRLFALFMVVLTLATAVYDFPSIWNQGAGYVEAKAGWQVPLLADEPFRLGLDLQGGTHLVYEANMSEIPEGDRLEALEGVRDVIERRVNAFGVSEPVVQTTSTGGTYRVIVELAGVSDVNEAINQIGETPILEFKEPGEGLDREPTDEENALLEELNIAEYELADDILKRAKAGEDFDTLIAEYSIESNKEETGGFIDGINETSFTYGAIGEAINDQNPRSGRVLSEWIETTEGLNIIKYNEETTTPEMLLSHILICFEGSTGCENPIPQIEANIVMGQVRDGLTAENFTDRAREFSTDKSGAGDGDLGWVLPGEMVPAFDIASQALAVGEISDVVETEFGYHVIYKRDARDVTTHSMHRVVLPLSTIYDVVPDVSPWVNTDLSGKDLDSAVVEFDPNTGAPYVTLNFKKEGGDKFAALTEAHVGEPIAIFLDGVAISTPIVQQAIFGGQAVITGNFTLEEAKLLAQRLTAGALPVPIDLLSQQTVGPTLGAISLQKSIEAAILGFTLVALFMILVYRIPGLLAVVALVFYAVLNLAAYRLFGVTTTLAGIAGFVLSLGIAVDANVLILERFKEEVRSGRDFSAAIDEGFKRAWNAIRDGNLTTLIAAGVLFWFSSSFIKGFAVTLSIGVLLSMFTAVFVTRIYMKALIQMGFMNKPWLFGTKKSKDL